MLPLATFTISHTFTFLQKRMVRKWCPMVSLLDPIFQVVPSKFCCLVLRCANDGSGNLGAQKT